MDFEILGEISEIETFASGHGIREPAVRRTGMAKIPAKDLVVCIRNNGYPASLEPRKIYVVLKDPLAEKQGMLRVVDESGEDYLYPKALFKPIALPESLKRAVLAAA